jgi:HEAT repeat protein
MFDAAEIPFDQVVLALLDDGKPFPAKYIYRLSDITPDEANSLTQAWERIPVRRRQSVMEDVQTMGEDDYLLDFNSVGRLALDDADPYVRLLAVRTLGEYEAVDLMSTFMHLVEHDPDFEVRAASASALGAFVYAGEIEEIPQKKLHQVETCLLKVMKNEKEPKVRRYALEALGFSSRDEVPEMIEAAYNIGDREWLVSALLAMGRSSNKRWKDQVLERLEDRRPDVRAEAAAAAGELAIKSAVRRLSALLDDTDDEVRAAAIWSLSEIGGAGVRGRLAALLEETEDDDEVDLLESALDNLAFTEDFKTFSILELSEEDELEDDLDDEGFLEEDFDDFEGDEDDDEAYEEDD